MRRVRIDPGHGSPLPTGGTDPGAVANGVQEAECVLEVSKLLAAMLRSQGVAVDMTRTALLGPTTDARATHLEQPGADCAISIHANAHSDSAATGMEVYVSAHNAESRRLGELIAAEWPSWVQGIALRQPAVRTRLGPGGEDYYYVIRHPTRAGIPAVMVELGFLTNSFDAAVLGSFWGRFQAAYALLRAALRWLGVEASMDELRRELAGVRLDMADARARLHQISILAREKGDE